MVNVVNIASKTTHFGMAKIFKRLYIDGAASLEELLVWN